jgi:hypothetical protein
LAVATALLVAAAVACSSGSGDDTGATSATRAAAATQLSVHGVATRAGSGPAEPVKVPFSGTLDCGDPPSGTGTFAADAAATCTGLATNSKTLAAAGNHAGRMCAEIYGGPQTARITGTVAGRRVDVRVARTDGCGIDDWTRLAWLLGPPER